LKDLVVLDDNNGPTKKQVEGNVVAPALADGFANE
jgi:hypothetical protein